MRWLTRHARSILIAPALTATSDQGAVATALVMARRNDGDGDVPDVPDTPDPPEPHLPHPLPHHRVIFADEVAQLTLPIVAAPEADRDAPLPVNYLQLDRRGRGAGAARRHRRRRDARRRCCTC